jgi:hypothetical protein
MTRFIKFKFTGRYDKEVPNLATLFPRNKSHRLTVRVYDFVMRTQRLQRCHVFLNAFVLPALLEFIAA